MINGKSHTLIIAVDIEAAGADLDTLTAAIETLPHVRVARDIATYEHKRYAQQVNPIIEIPAEKGGR